MPVTKPRMRTTFTLADKERILRVALSGKSKIADVARAENVKPRTLYKWIWDAKKEGKLPLQDTAPSSTDFAQREGATSAPLSSLKQYGAPKDLQNLSVEEIENQIQTLFEHLGRAQYERNRK